MISGRRILLLSPFQAWPLTQGAITRTHFLVRYLAEQNALWAAFRGRASVRELGPVRGTLPSTGNKYLLLLDPGLLRRSLALVRAEAIDLIVVSHIWSAAAGLALRRLTGIPFIFDDHNVEFLRFRRTGNRLWPAVRLLEARACRAAAQVLCVSDFDGAYLQREFHLASARLQVVPNGADFEGLAECPVDVRSVRVQLGIQAGEKMLLYFGARSYKPNAQAVDVLVNEIAPRLDAAGLAYRMVVAGSGHDEHYRARPPANGRILFPGFVDDITALIKSADLVLAPILSGSGTRLKILESVACGRRVVSTSLGAEGLDRAVMGASLIVRDDWAEFAECALAACAQPSSVAVDAALKGTYDWRAIVADIRLVSN